MNKQSSPAVRFSCKATDLIAFFGLIPPLMNLCTQECGCPISEQKKELPMSDSLAPRYADGTKK